MIDRQVLHTRGAPEREERGNKSREAGPISDQIASLIDDPRTSVSANGKHKKYILKPQEMANRVHSKIPA